MMHTQLFHFNETEFVEKLKESIESKDSLSISGGLNSPWRVNLNKLEMYLKNA